MWWVGAAMLRGAPTSFSFFGILNTELRYDNRQPHFSTILS